MIVKVLSTQYSYVESQESEHHKRNIFKQLKHQVSSWISTINQKKAQLIKSNSKQEEDKEQISEEKP